MSLYEFVESRFTKQTANHMVRLISGISTQDKRQTEHQRVERAKEHLRKYFVFVGTLETRDQQAEQSMKLFGIDRLTIKRHNVSPVPTIIDDATRRLIEDRRSKART